LPDPISWSLDWPYYLAALVFGYACGSIPFGLLVTRLAGLGDIRKIGSGNIGTTNVLRTGRKDLAALTLCGDALKGAAAVLVMMQWWGRDLAVTAGFGAFVGHLFPVWLGFRGGKGVATYIGVLLALYWPAGLAFLAIWIAVAALSRYSSAAALSASLVTPILLYAIDQFQFAELFAVLSLLLWLKHWQNIRRLATGAESKIGAGR
jgi:glycerol-3-phosphate acyltransferase PlsY